MYQHEPLLPLVASSLAFNFSLSRNIRLRFSGFSSNGILATTGLQAVARLVVQVQQEAALHQQAWFAASSSSIDGPLPEPCNWSSNFSNSSSVIRSSPSDIAETGAATGGGGGGVELRTIARTVQFI